MVTDQRRHARRRARQTRAERFGWTRAKIEETARIDVVPEMRACPFCRSGDKLALTDTGNEACVDCNNCGASGPWVYPTLEGKEVDDAHLRRAGAIVAWNSATR